MTGAATFLAVLLVFLFVCFHNKAFTFAVSACDAHGESLFGQFHEHNKVAARAAVSARHKAVAYDLLKPAALRA
jgi:hypothetical protein